MAERRMFTNKITEADEFTKLPPTTQCLYFHLCMNADDDGFSNKVRQSMFNSHADQHDYELLVEKRFIIPFDSGVIVIKHWRMHNLIRTDRYHETDYLKEKSALILKKNGVYTEKQPTDNQLTTTCQPTDNQMETEVRLGKDSIGKDSNISISNEIDCRENSTYAQDVYKEIIDYLNQKTGRKYRWQTKETKGHINARMGEGYSVDDFKRVIDIKCDEWKGTKWESYLQPSTLFAPSHFENYLNQGSVSDVKAQNDNQLEMFAKGEI